MMESSVTQLANFVVFMKTIGLYGESLNVSVLCCNEPVLYKDDIMQIACYFCCEYYLSTKIDYLAAA